MDILNKILELLKMQGKKQVDLAEFLDLKKNAISDWKAGRNDSYIKYLPKIAEFLGVSVDYLLGKDTQNSKNDFTVALHNELTHDLTSEDLQQLQNFADFLRNQKKQNGK